MLHLHRKALTVCLTGLLFAAMMAVSPGAFARKLPQYSDAVIAEWQQRYPRGIYSNFREVILPRLSSEQRARLGDLVFEFPPRIEGHEPFGFAADANGQIIYMSVQSLKFLDDASIAVRLAQSQRLHFWRVSPTTGLC